MTRVGIRAGLADHVGPRELLFGVCALLGIRVTGAWKTGGFG